MTANSLVRLTSMFLANGKNSDEPWLSYYVVTRPGFSTVANAARKDSTLASSNDGHSRNSTAYICTLLSESSCKGLRIRLLADPGSRSNGDWRALLTPNGNVHFAKA